MSKNHALNLAINIIRRFADDLYGRGAKYHPDKLHKWDELMQVIDCLESMKEV